MREVSASGTTWRWSDGPQDWDRVSVPLSEYWCACGRFIDSTFMTRQRHYICLSPRWRCAYISLARQPVMLLLLLLLPRWPGPTPLYAVRHIVRMNVAQIIYQASLRDPCIILWNIFLIYWYTVRETSIICIIGLLKWFVFPRFTPPQCYVWSAMPFLKCTSSWTQTRHSKSTHTRARTHTAGLRRAGQWTFWVCLSVCLWTRLIK